MLPLVVLLSVAQVKPIEVLISQEPQLAFMRGLNVKEIRSRQYFKGHGRNNELTVDALFKAWDCYTDKWAQPVAHFLKSNLTKKNGWNLSFPSMRDPYDAEATHYTRGKADLHFSTKNPSGMSSGRIFFMIWDESKPIEAKNRENLKPVIADV